MISDSEGEKLVKLARDSVVNYFKGVETSFGKSKNSGVFVTIYSRNSLRGCIGFIEPVYELNDGIVKAALSAAFSDSRFSPVKRDELSDLNFEVSVLSKPSLIDASGLEILSHIELGKDGLIVEKDFHKGLLLPSVATEHKMSKIEFIEHTCLKAGLDRNSWKENSCKVFKFQTQVFSEN